MEHFHYACGCAGQKIILAEHYLAHIYCVKCINVLFGVNCFDYCLVVKVLRKRKLNENTVDVRLFVESFYK